MNHPFGPSGPYFNPPCQRDRFPSLLNEMDKMGDIFVAHLGVPNIVDMGARMKRGRLPNANAEGRARKAAKAAKLYSIRFITEGMRRAVDIYVQRPIRNKRQTYTSIEQESLTYETIWASGKSYKTNKQGNKGKQNNNAAVKRQPKRQAGEPPYTGHCKHCQLQDTDDIKCDAYGRTLARESRVLEHLKFFNEIMNMHRHLLRNQHRYYV